MRPDQLVSFKTAAVQRFENLMVEHLKKFFPAEYDETGEPQVRELIRYGIGRAQIYRITAECDVSVFLDVMFVMGRDFDLRRENAWAIPVLKDTRASATERVMKLRDAALEHLRSKKAGNAN